MSGEDRRDQLVAVLKGSDEVISGTDLATRFGVSRQVIVQDVALLRANGHEIISKKRGYSIRKNEKPTRVFKMHHTPDNYQDELNLIVDYGGHVEDIFIYHKYYGIVRAPMKIHSRRDVMQFMKDVQSGESSFLSNATNGYHYHTVTAESEEILEEILEQLRTKGFLAALTDYEPVDFWGENAEI